MGILFKLETMRFFISDTHFSHEETVSFFERPFTSAEEMDKKLIENWNSVVSENDIVYCLGDFAMRTPKLYTEKLNGKLILVIGNHDYKEEVLECFDEVHDYLQIEIGGNKVHMSHYPYKQNVGPYDKRFLPIMLNDEGDWLLHGHVHNKAPKFVDKSINCCVEHWNYTPVSEIQIETIMKEYKNV